MSNRIEFVKEKLDEAIKQLCDTPKLFTENPEKHFTRNRKLPMEVIIRLLLSMEGSSMNSEVLRYFNCKPDFATPSALVQQRKKISDTAFQTLFSSFVKLTDTPKLYNGYRLLAVDGSDVHIPTNPDDTDSYFLPSHGEKPFNLLHLDALYDLMQHTYLDACVTKRRNWNEGARLCDMLERLALLKAIIIADRGYESYNVMAHIQKKHLKFLIRIKDINSSGIASGLDLPSTPEFDVSLCLNLTKQRTNEMIELAKSKNEYKILTSQYNFDCFPTPDKNNPHGFFCLSFRVVRVEISDGKYELLATNLDEKEFPPRLLKELYSMRWGIETSFRELKYTVGLVNFHAKKVEFIIQEIFARLIMYNFSELIVLHTIIRKSKTKHPYKVNFSAAVQVCRQFLRGNVTPPEVEAVLSRNTSPVRPGRCFPRKLTTRSSVSFLYRVA